MGDTEMTAPQYIFSEIPNDPRGRSIVRLMKRYLNKDRYEMRVKGQFLREGENWRHYPYGQPISKSKCLRIYIKEKKV